MSDDSRPATKQDLNELRDQLVEQMREMQTEILRLFDDRLRPVEIRLQAIPRLDERLGLIEERVRRLEFNHKIQ